MVVRTPGNPGIHLEFEISLGKPGIRKKKVEKCLEFEIFQMNFYFAKILTRLFDFRKLQSIDQSLPSLRTRVKFTWNFTVYIDFYTWKSCIFHMENLKFSF